MKMAWLRASKCRSLAGSCCRLPVCPGCHLTGGPHWLSRLRSAFSFRSCFHFLLTEPFEPQRASAGWPRAIGWPRAVARPSSACRAPVLPALLHPPSLPPGLAPAVLATGVRASLAVRRAGRFEADDCPGLPISRRRRRSAEMWPRPSRLSAGRRFPNCRGPRYVARKHVLAMVSLVSRCMSRIVAIQPCDGSPAPACEPLAGPWALRNVPNPLRDPRECRKYEEPDIEELA